MTDELLERNARWAETFPHAGLAAPPSGKVAVVVCMDARIDPLAALGLDLGEAHVIRNAGGIATDDVIRSLAISQRFLGTESVLVVQHTRCGMQTFTDDELADALETETGERPSWQAGTFSDLDASVRSSCAAIRASPFVPHSGGVWGAVYDVETGRLRAVVTPDGDAA